VTVLAAIGKLEANSVGNSSSMESLVQIVIDKMVPYLQQEGTSGFNIDKFLGTCQKLAGGRGWNHGEADIFSAIEKGRVRKKRPDILINQFHFQTIRLNSTCALIG